MLLFLSFSSFSTLDFVDKGVDKIRKVSLDYFVGGLYFIVHPKEIITGSLVKKLRFFHPNGHYCVYKEKPGMENIIFDVKYRTPLLRFTKILGPNLTLLSSSSFCFSKNSCGCSAGVPVDLFFVSVSTLFPCFSLCSRKTVL